MTSPKHHGKCHVCGIKGKLSFEHVPPESAFNDLPILKADIRRLIEATSLDEIRGKTNQRGSGAYTLCAKCNNDTGAWYGNEYVRWVKQGMEIVNQTKVQSVITRRVMICPLNVLKEILCMMCSVNSPDFAENFPWVRKFVRNRHYREWDPRFRIYANYNVSTRPRFSGGQGILKGTTTHVISEVAYPPFSYVMTHASPPPSDLLVDITFFVESLYNELREVWMNMPVVCHYTYYPADFRTEEQVKKEAANA